MKKPEILAKTLQNLTAPALYVDLDALDQNIDSIEKSLKEKSIRISTKSIRVPEIIRYIANRLGTKCSGLLCYSPEEASYWLNTSTLNILLAYPFGHIEDLNIINGTNLERLTFMVDNPTHLHILHQWSILKKTSRISVCIDIDVGFQWCGLHLGAKRSPLRNDHQLSAFLDSLMNFGSLFQLAGVMGYEANVSGLPDALPHNRFANYVKRFLKKKFFSFAVKRRRATLALIGEKNISIQYFNGGGTGSLCESATDKSLTEISIGSGFLKPAIFDYFQNNTNIPALFFSLRITRRPENKIATAHGGGFIASGTVSTMKQPVFVWPMNLKVTSQEGFGEVQTPILCESSDLSVGDIVLLRPAKSGEIAERFSHIIPLRKMNPLAPMKTYRGEGLTAH